MDTCIPAAERLSVLLKAGEECGFIKDAETIRTIPELVAQAKVVYSSVFLEMVQFFSAKGEATIDKICNSSMAFCAYAGIGGAALWLKGELPSDKLLIDVLCEPRGFDYMDEEAFKCAGIEYQSDEYYTIAQHIHNLAYSEYQFMQSIDTREQMNECFKAFYYYGMALIMDFAA